MTVWIGLTGGIGSGKSTVAKLFAELDIPIIDADKIAHSLTQENSEVLPRLIELFGEDICDNSGSLNRSLLRQKVLNDKKKLILLENILHPIIFDKIKIHQNQFNKSIYGIIEIPLLIEKPKFQTLIQRILVIDSSRRLRVQRIQQRNALSIQEINHLMNQQCSRWQRQSIADDIILNNFGIIQLKQQVEKLHHFYLQYFAYE